MLVVKGSTFRSIIKHGGRVCEPSRSCKEIKFIAQLLETMGFAVKKLIVVRLDNVGAIKCG